MAQGTYTLLINLPARATVSVGALGEHELAAGWYAYTGSAFGPGGFGRVDRHHRVATGEHEARHWHVDYFLGESAARIASAVRSVDADVECAVARQVDATLDADPPVDGFGASDCDCAAHLHSADERDALETAVREAHDEHALGD